MEIVLPPEIFGFVLYQKRLRKFKCYVTSCQELTISASIGSLPSSYSDFLAFFSTEADVLRHPYITNPSSQTPHHIVFCTFY